MSQCSLSQFFRFEEILKKIQVVELTLITFFCHNSKSGVLLSRHKPKEHIIFDTFFTEFTKLKKIIILTNHLSSKTLNNPFRSTLTEYNPGQTKVPFPFGPMNNLFKKYYFSLDLRFYGIRKTEPSMFNQLSHKNISEVHLGRNKIGRLQSGTLEGLETVR